MLNNEKEERRKKNEFRYDKAMYEAKVERALIRYAMGVAGWKLNPPCLPGPDGT